MKLVSVVTACIAAVGLTGQTAQASFHFMQIEQIIGGVNGDTTAQAIQLRMRSAFQNQVQFSRIRAHDAAGLNPVIIATFLSPVANSATGARVLITSANFANYTNALVTDRVMTNPIPASYLTAGSLTFEDTGGTIYWRVSWGGASYTGSVIGSITNDSDGNFGKLTAALQSTNLQAVKFLGAATALSVTNSTDYALSATPAIFTNNAGTNFTVIAGCPIITVAPVTLPNAEAGENYNENISASGGASPYTYAVTSGSLPSGLTLASDGLLSGTADGIGLSNFTVTATASNTCTGQRAYSLNVVCPPVTITPPTVPSGSVGVAYNQALTADGGSAPYSFIVSTGSLPNGLSLSEGGVISGTPDTGGTSNFTVTATNAEDCPGNQAYSLTIAGGTVPGDLDGNGAPNGIDIRHFVECVISGSTSGGTCPPGDFNNSGGVDVADVAQFIAALLAA